MPDSVKKRVIEVVTESKGGLKPSEILKQFDEPLEARRAMEALIDSGKLDVRADLKVAVRAEK